jgi:hypothetical protein
LFHPYGVDLTFVGLVMNISSLRDLINTRWIFAKLISSNGIRKIKNDKRKPSVASEFFGSVRSVVKGMREMPHCLGLKSKAEILAVRIVLQIDVVWIGGKVWMRFSVVKHFFLIQ